MSPAGRLFRVVLCVRAVWLQSGIPVQAHVAAFPFSLFDPERLSLFFGDTEVSSCESRPGRAR